jgi:phosphatidylglycerophosphate synthase
MPKDKRKKNTISRYRQLCQKGDQENYIFDQLIARKISIYLTIPMIWVGIQPNQATFLSLLSLVASFYFFLFNTPIMLITGTNLVLLYYLLDHVDGELSRYYSKTDTKKLNSQDGHYFDILCHRFSGNVIIFLFGLSAYYRFGYEWPILAAFAISIGMNRFPELVANKLIVNIVANHPQKIEENSVKVILGILELKNNQIAGVRAPITDITKWVKAIKELLGFPGLLIMIMIVSLLDALLPGFALFSMPINFRLLLIILLLPIELLRILTSSIKYFHLFKQVIV